MRKCTRCNEVKPFSEFGKHKNCKDGLNPECKECNKARTRAYGKTPSGVYTRLKSRATFFSNRTITISRADFIEWYNSQDRVCVYCDINEGELEKLSDPVNLTTPLLTIDCKDNEKKYAKGNLALACRRCNFVKTDIFTYDEMRYIGQNFIKPKWEEQLSLYHSSC